MLNRNDLLKFPRDHYGIVLPYPPPFFMERLRDAWEVFRGRAQAIKESGRAKNKP